MGMKERHLLEYLSSKTATNFQQSFESIMNSMYSNDYLPTKQMGGDGGIDGRLKKDEKYIYYAIGGYSSTKDIQDKILADAKKIKENLICKGEWGFDPKTTEKFCFVVQTIDQPIPNSIQGRYPDFSNDVKEILSKNGECFEFEIINAEMFIKSFKPYQIEKIYSDIYSINNIFESLNNFVTTSKYFNFPDKYARISTEDKIYQNNLKECKKFIEDRILELDFIEALNNWQKDGGNMMIFDEFKEYIQNLYRMYNDNLEGEALLKKIIEQTYENSALTRENSGKLVIYIFDRCDIF